MLLWYSKHASPHCNGSDLHYNNHESSHDPAAVTARTYIAGLARRVSEGLTPQLIDAATMAATKEIIAIFSMINPVHGVRAPRNAQPSTPVTIFCAFLGVWSVR